MFPKAADRLEKLMLFYVCRATHETQFSHSFTFILVSSSSAFFSIASL